MARVVPVLSLIGGEIVRLYTMVAEYVGRMKEPFMELVAFLEPFVSLFLNNVSTFFQGTFNNILLFIEGAFNMLAGIFEIGFSLI